MLSSSQKEAVLRKAGVVVQPFPARSLPVQERVLERRLDVPPEEAQATAEHECAVSEWRRGIEVLYEAHCARFEGPCKRQ